MRKIYLEYNPYKVETKILVDDVTPKRNSRLQVKDRRLQEWIEDNPEGGVPRYGVSAYISWYEPGL